MAHTLKAYYYTDPATAVTVDFMGAVSTNSGIALDAYQMGVPGVEQARNSSLYSDSPRPVYSKHGTVTDVLTVTVRGSTNTALYTNLHLLAKLGEYARTSTQNPNVQGAPYLELKPGGSSSGEVLYAPIYDCRVELPADWANVQDATKTIEDVTVTIERGMWQQYAPNTFSLTPNISATGQTLASSASSSVNIGGDTSALIYLYFLQTSGATTINRAIFGYRSKALGGANYASLGKKEAESQTNGTDTSDAADATASGGNKVQCTFATGAAGTVYTRLSGTGIPHGTHRVFARMKATSTQVATVNVKYQDDNNSAVVYVANSSVLVSSTSWLVYDLGVVRYFETGLGALYDDTVTGVWAIDASGTPGNGNLDIDWVYFMPTEGYMTASGFSLVYSASKPQSFIFTNSVNGSMIAQQALSGDFKRIAAVQHTASIAPQPGPFALYWLMGTDSGSVFDVGIVTTLSMYMSANARYIMPSLV
jgi:hypothetical protein